MEGSCQPREQSMSLGGGRTTRSRDRLRSRYLRLDTMSADTPLVRWTWMESTGNTERRYGACNFPQGISTWDSASKFHGFLVPSKHQHRSDVVLTQGHSSKKVPFRSFQIFHRLVLQEEEKSEIHFSALMSRGQSSSVWFWSADRSWIVELSYLWLSLVVVPVTAIVQYVTMSWSCSNVWSRLDQRKLQKYCQSAESLHCFTSQG